MHDDNLLIRVKEFLYNSAAGQGKKILILMDVEVVTPGNQVNSKIGNPIQIGVDGNFHRNRIMYIIAISS